MDPRQQMLATALLGDGEAQQQFAPFKPSATYDTKLNPLDEMAYRQWVQRNGVQTNPNATAPQDYDMRGYYQGMQQGNPQARPTEVNPNDNRPHFTDYYKTPMHQSFSDASQWANPATAPQWINGSQLATQGGRILVDEQRPQGPFTTALDQLK